MANGHKRAALGIIGGMGPLASAEFLKTIYERTIDAREQEAPIVLMYSDPTFPDRTEALLAGSSDVLLHRLVDTLRDLQERNVEEIVICCFTIHALLPLLPAHLSERITSLIDVVFDALVEQPQQTLLLCTTGTRQLKLFENHRRWPDIRQHVALPDDVDQADIHRHIYAIKQGNSLQSMTTFVYALLEKYRCGCFIAGCTELHMLAKHIATQPSRQGSCIDPLRIIAQRLAKERTHGTKKYL